MTEPIETPEPQSADLRAALATYNLTITMQLTKVINRRILGLLDRASPHDERSIEQIITDELAAALERY